MGRLLGSHADDQELDRPDLNKCPDCDCYFAGDNCPLCGKLCPEEMRAGNRPAVKPTKRKRGSRRSRGVMFIDWYHSWWFIVIMMLVFTPAGIVLLITSPHERWKKILFAVIAAVYMAISTFGIFGLQNLISDISDVFSSPVTKSLTREEYLAKCADISSEEFYRMSESYKDEFICMKLRVVTRVTYVDGYNEKDYVCYLCEAENGSDYKIVVRDCLLQDQQRFITGDIITVYGEGAEECQVHDSEYNYTTAPCVNMAYAEAQ